MRKLMHFRTLLIWPAFLILLRRETWRGTVPAAGAKRIGAKRRCGANRSEANRSEANRSETKMRSRETARSKVNLDGTKRSQAEAACSQSSPQGTEGGNSEQTRFPPSGSRRAVPAERHEKRGLESRNGCNALCRVRLARISRRFRHQHHERVSLCPTRRKSREVVALRPEIRRHPPHSLP